MTIPLSIVIPAHNRKSFVVRLAKQFLLQQSVAFEVLVIDDGSTDGTYEALVPFLCDRFNVYTIPNSERGYARDYGAQKSRGEYINFFDSDDIVYPIHVSKALECIVSNGNPPIVIFNSDYFVAGRVICRNFLRDCKKGKLALVSRGNQIPLNGVFIRADCYNKNPFTTCRDLSGSEDYELWVRLLFLYNPVICNISTSCLVEHCSRSVNAISLSKALIQFKALMSSLLLFEHESGLALPSSIYSYVYMYFALQLSTHLTARVAAVRFLVIAIFKAPLSFSLKVSIVVLRNLLFN